jgi:deoxycytidylate deaminase
MATPETRTASDGDRRGRSGELVVAIVAPVGTETEKVWRSIRAILGSFNYSSHQLRVSWFFEDQKVALLISQSVRKGTEYERLTTSMDAGDALRKKTGLNEAMALVACSYINEKREEITSNESARAPENEAVTNDARAGRTSNAASRSSSAKGPLRRAAYLLHSLKRPEEVVYLRRVYGSRFLLISVYVPRNERIRSLQHRGMEEPEAVALVVRDESGGQYGQATGKCFQMADIFVDGNRSEEEIRKDLYRFFDLVFGSPLVTPNQHEHAMFLAFAASLRSGDLSRQVGAVVTSPDGAIVADGANDAPRAFGGQYWPDASDQRDLARGYDSNERIKTRMVRAAAGEIHKRASDVEELPPVQTDEGDQLLLKVIGDALRGGSADEADILRIVENGLREAGFLDITEFGRAVHAEMAALLSCARRGVPTKMHNLYCTTFPCHNCTKHIVAAGISRVYFIEPYPKSRAEELHGDSISMNGEEAKVQLLPFVGIGPRRYVELFMLWDPFGNALNRKAKEGVVVEWKRDEAWPLLPDRLINYPRS